MSYVSLLRQSVRQGPLEVLLVPAGEDLASAQMPLALAVLAQGQVVAAESLGRLDLPRPRHAEALHGAPLGLQLRHCPSHLEKGSGLLPQAAPEINPLEVRAMPWQALAGARPPGEARMRSAAERRSWACQRGGSVAVALRDEDPAPRGGPDRQTAPGRP